MGARSVRSRLQPSGDADREVGRCDRARPDLRIHRQGAERAGSRAAGVLQRAAEGDAEPRARHPHRQEDVRKLIRGGRYLD